MKPKLIRNHRSRSCHEIIGFFVAAQNDYNKVEAQLDGDRLCRCYGLIRVDVI